MNEEETKEQLLQSNETIRILQEELAETNRGLLALALELELRVDERTAELRITQEELQRTNSDLLQMTLELEDRVNLRTAALHESEERYRTVADYTYDWEYWRDPDGKILYMSPSCERISGYSPHEFIEDPGLLERIVHPDDHHHYEEHIFLADHDVDDQRVHQADFRILRRDGEMRWIGHTCTQIRRDDGTSLGRRATNRDITERKLAENAVVQYSQRLAVINHLDHIISSNLDIVTIYDAFVKEMNELVAFNRTSIILLDDTSENWQIFRQWTLGETALQPSDWHPLKGTAVEWITHYRQAFLENRLGEMAEWPEHKSLRQEGIQSRVLLPLMIQGKVIGLLTFASQQLDAYSSMDVLLLQTLADQLAIAVQNAKLYAQAQLTAEELEQRVQARTAQLEKANKDLESFSYSVSHDLRAPLRAINGFAQILSRRHRELLDAEGQHYLDNVVEASNRMGVLIDDLLQYSRVGRASVRRQPVSMDDLFASILADLSPRIVETSAVVELPPPGTTPQILSDPTILSQIFSNIIGNALTYHRQNVPPVIQVTYQMETDQHLFRISDNGIGIQAEYLEKIFNVFQRLHSTEDYPGTGIGLAIVRKSAELLDGRVWAESIVGAGSTFWIQIPKG